MLISYKKWYDTNKFAIQKNVSMEMCHYLYFEQTWHIKSEYRFWNQNIYHQILNLTEKCHK